jgi:hypothetical protein
MHLIAERKLTLKRADATESSVLVRMWSPEPTGRRGWSCLVEFVTPGERTIRFSGSGADAFQAITFALHMIPTRLLRFADVGEISCEGAEGHWFPPILIQSSAAEAPPDEETTQGKDAGMGDGHDFTPVAERRFRVVGDPARELQLELGKPFLDSDPSRGWTCPYIIRGTEGARVQLVHGIDAVDALLVAMQSARADLEGAGLVVEYEGSERGDTGLPK